MENQNDNKEMNEKAGDCCGQKSGWHGRGYKGFWLILVLLLVIGSIFCFSFSFGSRNFSNRFRAGFYPMAVAGRGGMINWNVNGNFPIGGMMRGWQEFSQNNIFQIFGVVSKIEGAKITIVDNGNQEKIISSVPDTRIISATGQVSLSFLKTGQNISASGVMKDNQLQANIIRIY